MKKARVCVCKKFIEGKKMFENIFLRFFERIYLWIIRFFSNWQSVFLFILRLTWGHQFFLIGYKKFQSLGNTAQFFESLFIPFPHFHAYLVAFIELVGGFCLVVGLGSRFWAILLSIVMFGAYSTAHVHIFKDFAFVMNPSLLVKEAPFPFLMTSLITLIFGPGKISLDGWFKRLLEHRKGFY